MADRRQVRGGTEAGSPRSARFRVARAAEKSGPVAQETTYILARDRTGIWIHGEQCTFLPLAARAGDARPETGGRGFR